MLDLVYKTVQTIINKENQGYLSPFEFNLIINNVQQEIFRSYFEDENLDKNKQNRGLTNLGYSNLPFNQRQRISQFSDYKQLIKTKGASRFILPTDLYFIEDNGITTNDGIVVEEVEHHQKGYLNITEVKPSSQYPTYQRFYNEIVVEPISILTINISYLRKPKFPNWTYFELSTGDPIFDPSNPNFQDIELHESEFYNVVIRTLSHFGINLRERDVIQTAELLKDKQNTKDNN